MTMEWAILLSKVIVVLLGLLTVVPIMLFVERRGSALMQNRLGPNRIGPFGFLQTVADIGKFLFKEDRSWGHVDRFYFTIAPWIVVIPALMTFAAIPFASTIDWRGFHIQFQAANLDVGILYCFSIASLGVYGIIIGGWASNNKYSLLGGLRSSSQMISYELSMGLSIIGILMVFSSVKLGDIARAQGETLIQLGVFHIPKWGIFIQPLGFLLFLTSVFAETNRLPFDLPEGESEIVAGYHLEYGSMRFALFMMAEYINMAVASALVSTLFFGGWQMLPGFHALHAALFSSSPFEVQEWARVVMEAVSLLLKISFFMWLFVWVRWTLPRFRFDQLMSFGWKVMFPLAMANVLLTSFLIYKGFI